MSGEHVGYGIGVDDVTAVLLDEWWGVEPGSFRITTWSFNLKYTSTPSEEGFRFATGAPGGGTWFISGPLSSIKAVRTR